MGPHFELVGMKMTWFAQLYLKKAMLGRFKYLVGRIIGGPISFLANLSPYACDRIWCFWVGGFEEIYYNFKCKK